MTNPDREELVKLSDDLDSFAHDMREDANDATALWLEQRIAILRRLASSDSGVKVRELEWGYNNVAASSLGKYMIDGWSNGEFSIAIPGRYDNGTRYPTLDAAKAAAQADYEARIKSALVEVPAVNGEPEPVAWPANLNPRTLDLVQRFALALAKKLRLAEEKYDHTDGWLRDDWESECRDHLYQHLEKGDPRDVAAYCAFMWHHDWITCRPVITAPPADAVEIERLRAQLLITKRSRNYQKDRAVKARSAQNDLAKGVKYWKARAEAADAGMREALEDCRTHRRAWHDALEAARDRSPDEADESYWRHELGAFNRTFDALTAPGATTKSAEGAVSSLPSGESEPAVTQASPSADTGDEYLAGIMATTKSDGGGFQDRVQPWMLACFGPVIPFDKTERNHRFLEEALELVQSIGCTQSEAHQLVDYVFGRPVGDPVQEVGGVMVTLAALCLANDLDMAAAGETELARIWTKVEAIRAKQAAKPKHSPLPGPSDPSSTRSENQIMTDDQIKHMVDRFIGWKLPEDFNPDCGISFKRTHSEQSQWGPQKYEPIGTNLFDATQATEMVRHMLEGLPSTRSEVTVEECARKCADNFVQIIEVAMRVARRTGNTFVMDRQKIATMIAGHFAPLLDQFEIRRK